MTKEGLLNCIVGKDPEKFNRYALRQVIQQHRHPVAGRILFVVYGIINLMECTKVDVLPEFLSCST